MGEATKSYKYTSNKDSRDGTELISVPGGEPVRQGGVIELTEAEHDAFKGRFNLHEVEPAGNENVTQGSGKPPETDK